MKSIWIHAALAFSLSLIAPVYADDGDDWAKDFADGQSAFNAKNYAVAEQSLKQALSKTEARGPGSMEVSNCCAWLGGTYLMQGRFADAEPLLQEAATIREKLLGSDSPTRAGSLMQWADVLLVQKRYLESLPVYLRALEIFEKLPESEPHLNCLNRVVVVYETLEKYAPAESFALRCVAASEALHGKDNLATYVPLNQLALIYETLGKYKEAETSFNLAKALRVASGHSTVDIDGNLAHIYRLQNRNFEAVAAYEKQLQADSAINPEAPYTLAAMNNLALSYTDIANYPKAEALFRQCLSLREKIDSESVDVANSLESLGELLKVTGKFGEAEDCELHALALYKKNVGQTHSMVANCLKNLGGIYSREGKYSEAEKSFAQALDIQTSIFGPGSREVSQTLSQSAAMFALAGQDEKAELNILKALKILEVKGSRNSLSYSGYLQQLAGIHRREGHFQESETEYKTAIAIFEKAAGPEHPDTATVLSNLAVLYIDENRLVEAGPLLQRCLIIKEKILGPKHPETAACLLQMAELSDELGDRSAAHAYLDRCIKIREATLGPDHPLVASAMNSQGQIFLNEGRIVEATSAYASSKQILDKLAKPAPDIMVVTLAGLGSCAMRSDDLAGAAKMLKQAVDISRQQLANDVLNRMYIIAILADVEIALHQFDDAEKLLLEAQTIRAKSFGSTRKTEGNILFEQASRMKYLAASDLAAMLPSSTNTNVESTIDKAKSSFSSASNLNLSTDSSPLFSASALKNQKALAKTSDDFEDFALISLANNVKDADYPILTDLNLAEVAEEQSKPNSLPRLAFSQMEFSIALHSLNANGLEMAIKSYKNLQGWIEQRKSRITANKNLSATQEDRLATDTALALAYFFADRNIKYYAIKCADIAQAITVDASMNELIKFDIFLTLADFYRYNSNYAEAEEALDDAASQIAKCPSDGNRLTSRYLLQRVQLMMQKGNYIEAASLIQKTLSGFAPGSADYLLTLQLSSQCSAEVYLAADIGPASEELHSQANETYKIALNKFEKLYGANSIKLCPILLNGATVSIHSNDFSIAKEQLNRILLLSDDGTNQSSESRTVRGVAFENLGAMAVAEQKPDEAEQYILKALQLHWADKSPTGLLFRAEDTSILASIYKIKNNNALSFARAYDAALRIGQYIDSSFSTLSFAEQCAFLDTLKSQISKFIGLTAEAQDFSKPYSSIFRWKGLLINSLAQQAEIAKSVRERPDLKNIVSTLDAMEVERSSTIIGGTNKFDDTLGSFNKYDRTWRSLNAKVDSKFVDPLFKCNLVDFQNFLQPDECFVDFYTYLPFDKTSPSGCEAPRYCAILTTSSSSPGADRAADSNKANVPASVKFIDIADVSETDSSLQNWLESLANPVGSQPATLLAAAPSTVANPVHRRAITLMAGSDESTKSGVSEIEQRAMLRQLIWNKVVQQIPSNISHLWTCPDGELSRLPWNLLQDESTKPLTVHEVDSAREFVSLRKRQRRNSSENLAVLIGGVDYGDENIPSLPGTVIEVQNIQKVAESSGLHAKMLTGLQPTADEIKSIVPTASFAHFATHGYFEQQKKPNLSRGVGQTSSIDQLLSRSPLVGSGLVVAKGAKADALAASTTTSQHRSSNLLSSEEVVQIDLNNCSLATLSACETGRGSQRTGQGVLGLRSAILAAGADAVLISLWKVDDQSTRFLMEQFYKQLWSKEVGMTNSLALKRAQAATKAQAQWSEPFYWAGFKIVGKDS